MLNEVTLLHVKGAVKFAIEGTNNAAAIHTENASIIQGVEARTLYAFEFRLDDRRTLFAGDRATAL